ncbi:MULTISPECIES: NAD(P)(+) transhydrogenase (Re/Si-specific) subunit beta [unclassified Nocardioides]|uniref:NAD(P)(+) transhydrogenase (Re/Si-specific) subunit beta n=1 Tax=unclassified Nocardioides TaxID=2615069 RepID=UPI00005702DE|nr:MULTISPECIES: NAD(P)(+) transhydrogenase (Re/Si-specific) subunit beta [unclassified Nocardioides]ABL80344.1 hypothetical protein Noca_0820 [Nocardioides sp. JS614]
MVIRILRESADGERRVAATSSAVTRLIGLGYDVMVDPMASGCAGVQNPLFFGPNSSMLFRDAKQRVDELVQEL